jgi:hypothetical protein
MLSRMTHRWFYFVLIAFACVVGCATWRSASKVPSGNQVVLDQLVFYSNFPLPQQHRLLEDLRAERALVSTKLALPVSDEPIHVYLFATAEEFKAHAKAHYPDISNRRAFFVESDTRLMVYAYWGDRVAEDLRHEVAHGYLHAVVRDLPLWLDEGLAEYFEVPRGHRGFNPAHMEWLLNAAPLGWKPDLRRLEQLDSPGGMTQMDYAESWAWVHWLLETTPERQAFLRSYLSRMRDGGEIEPLSVALRQLQLDFEKQLADHVSSLAKP